jgi:hypothetical protein
MVAKRPRKGRTKTKLRPFSFMRRLEEIGMFFRKQSPQHQTMRRLVRRLEKAGVPYAIMGAMALNAHKAERTTADVDVLLTPSGLEIFRSELLPRFYRTVEGRARRFVEKKSGVTVDCLVTGRFPGSGKPGPIAFPDPEAASEEIDKIRVITLPHLIQLKLAARRHKDFGDVVFLIQVHELDETFLQQLHPSLHRDFIECLEEMRREEEYEAREGEPP